VKSVKRIIKIAVGIFFVILGVIGLFLPILQGVLFIGIGLAILSTESRRLKTLFHKLRERFPEKLGGIRAGESGEEIGEKSAKEAEESGKEAGESGDSREETGGESVKETGEAGKAKKESGTTTGAGATTEAG
jgi:hypothetical protein